MFVSEQRVWMETHLHKWVTQSYTTSAVSIGTHTYYIHVHVKYRSLLQYTDWHIKGAVVFLKLMPYTACCNNTVISGVLF